MNATGDLQLRLVAPRLALPASAGVDDDQAEALAPQVRSVVAGRVCAGLTKWKICSIKWSRDERHVTAPLKQYVSACTAHECRVKRCKTRPNALTPRILLCSDTCLAMARCVRHFAPAHAGASCLEAPEGLIDGPDRSNPTSVFPEFAEG